MNECISTVRVKHYKGHHVDFQVRFMKCRCGIHDDVEVNAFHPDKKKSAIHHHIISMIMYHTSTPHFLPC